MRYYVRYFVHDFVRSYATQSEAMCVFVRHFAPGFYSVRKYATDVCLYVRCVCDYVRYRVRTALCYHVCYLFAAR